MSRRTQTDIDVKNLCSRKLYELYSSRAVDADDLDAIIDELQLRRHYLSALEHKLESKTSARATRH